MPTSDLAGWARAGLSSRKRAAGCQEGELCVFVCLFVGVYVPVRFCVSLRRLFPASAAFPSPPPLRFSFFFSLFLIVVFFLMRT